MKILNEDMVRSHTRFAVCESSTMPTAGREAEAVAGKSTLQIVGLHPGFCSPVHFLS